ncbi:MAG: FtsQ-type POTRA domain-containing protein [Candidatus Eisenbacteria bacterium]|nr:FtsQ-type POTRA domain-containing protein [Candidatus Eisenbacteria bacterium]
MKTSYLGGATAGKTRRRRHLAAPLILILFSLAYFAFSPDAVPVRKLGKVWYFVRETDFIPRLSLFRIRTIQIEGNEYLLKEDVLETARIPRDRNLLRIDPKLIENRLLSHPRIRYANVRRVPPGTIRIAVRERRPVALIQCGKLNEVDADGVVLSSAVSGVVADLPIVSGIQVGKMRPGQRVQSDQLRFAIHLISELMTPEVGLSKTISEVRFSSSGAVYLYMTGGCAKAVLSKDDVERGKLVGLRLVMSDLRKKGIDAESIDLRFSNQFVVTKRGEASPHFDNTVPD